MDSPRARIVAFHLPQFHPTPDNDRWWGEGFTEWTNVTRAKPQFRHHAQPVLPADLGFYDLRLSQAREAQATLARAHGIEAFCYWHYWFEGQRLLEKPVEGILADGEPHFPFCLAWANESWSRRWLGEEKDVLQPQTYSAEDDAQHAVYLARVFSDPRYLRVDGRPVFLVYRPMDHPDIGGFINTLLARCAEDDLRPPYCVAINAHARHASYRELGFDAVVDFQPQLGVLPGALGDGHTIRRIVRNVRQGVWRRSVRIYDEEDARRRFDASRPASADIPCIFVGWDNTPRRGRNAIVVRSRGTDSFRNALSAAVERVASRPAQERLVFVNAWNEWAEGNHLEPDQAGGRAMLQVVKETVEVDGIVVCADAAQPK